MSFLSNLLGGGERDLGGVRPPWGARPSICRHVAAHVPASGPGLSEGGYALPDPEPATEGGITWDPGGRDGIVAVTPDPAKAARVLAALAALVHRSDHRRAAALYALVQKWRALEYVDLLLPPAAALDCGRLRAVARWLVEGAADREAVKVGIALLAIAPGDGDRELLLTLARHDELTLFAAKTLARSGSSPTRLAMELGTLATGWGRIQMVRRLEGTRDPEARAWLLRVGSRDTTPHDHTALICARDGGLAEALRRPDPDDALLATAGRILDALVTYGRIHDYPDAEEAAELYLRHLAGRAPDLDHAHAVGEVLDFAEEDGEDFYHEEWEDEEDRETFPRWPARREEIMTAARAYLARPEWPARLREWLAADDRAVFDRAVGVARRLGIDTWEAHFERVRRGLGIGRDWPRLLNDGDREQTLRALDLADAVLDPDHDTGPRFDLERSFWDRTHEALGHVVHALRRFPGRGWPMVSAALRSPMVYQRNGAVDTLNWWPRESWPPDAEPAHRAALAAERDAKTRDRMRRALAGERLVDWRFADWPRDQLETFLKEYGDE